MNCCQSWSISSISMSALRAHPNLNRRSVLFVIACLLFCSVASVALCSAQTVTTVYNFKTASGSFPLSVRPVQGRDGKLYGTTGGGGTKSDGTVFRIATGGGGGPIYNFTGSTGGRSPVGGPLLGTNGVFYGTTQLGGTSGSDGVLFSITTAGVYTVMQNFPRGSGMSQGSPIQASDGNLYGANSNSVYKYTQSGTFTTIYKLEGSQTYYEEGPVVQTVDGSLYIAVYNGGASGCGSILQLSTAGVLENTYSFDCLTASNPTGPVLQAADGNLYGVTYNGGTHGRGVLYEIPQGGTLTVLYNFGSSSTDGEYPSGTLTQGTDGNLYGVTTHGGTAGVGSLYQYTLSGTYTQLYSFPGKSGFPTTGPLQHTNGKFYGTTNAGGTAGEGRLYSLDMGLGPFVALVSSSAKVGGTVEVLGQGFTGTTSVTLNGLAASFSVVSDTYLTATVPSGVTTGPVVVTMPSGDLTSNTNLVIIH